MIEKFLSRVILGAILLGIPLSIALLVAYALPGVVVGALVVLFLALPLMWLVGDITLDYRKNRSG